MLSAAKDRLRSMLLQDLTGLLEIELLLAQHLSFMIEVKTTL